MRAMLHGGVAIKSAVNQLSPLPRHNHGRLIHQACSWSCTFSMCMLGMVCRNASASNAAKVQWDHG